MEENILPNCSIIIHEDTFEAENIKPTICPLCKSVLQLYQIHFDEKFLMCGNVECAYPIGITDYHIYKVECNEEVVRPDSRNSPGCSTVTSGSTVSNMDWLELEKSMQIDNPCSPASSLSLVEKPDIEKLEKMKQKVAAEEVIRQNVKKIKELNKKLFEKDEFLDSINNEKWIKHLAEMQERSGVKVLKDHELKKVKQSKSANANSELKIDIDSSNNVICLKLDGNDKSATK